MMNTMKVFAVGVAALILLTACGGSSTSSTGEATDPGSITGQFVDAAVEGLVYECSSGNTGTTDSEGHFTCNVGDNVTFSYNGFVLGTGVASSIMTPMSIQADPQAMLDMAQMLQTLDTDNNPSNGITLPLSGAQFDAFAALNLSLGDVDFDAAVAAAIGETLVDEATAELHLTESLPIQQFLAGKTLWPERLSGVFSESWTFNGDASEMDASGLDEWGAWSGTTASVAYDTINPNLMTLTVTAAVDAAEIGQTVTLEYIDRTDTYVIFSMESNWGRFYFNEADSHILNSVSLYPEQVTSAIADRLDFSADTSDVTAVEVSTSAHSYAITSLDNGNLLQMTGDTVQSLELVHHADTYLQVKYDDNTSDATLPIDLKLYFIPPAGYPTLPESSCPVAITADATVDDTTQASATVDGENHWVCPGTTLTVAAQYNTLFLEDRADASITTGSGQTIWASGSSSILLGTSGNTIYHDGSANITDLIGANTIITCSGGVLFDTSFAPLPGCQ